MPPVNLDDSSVPVVVGKEHRLRHNKAGPRPWRLLFLDTETSIHSQDDTTEWHRFRLGWTCYVECRRPPRSATVRWKFHRTPQSVCTEIDRLSADKKPLYLIGSNPNFDLWVSKFYGLMYRKGWRASFLMDEGLRFILTCQREGRQVVVLAIQNFFPVGVGALGVMLGTPKLDVDPLRAPEAEVKAYCRRDVEIVRDAFMGYRDFLDRHDLGGFAYTVSGQAMRAFRHRFLRTRVWVHKYPQVLKLERDAYCGGRTEAWRIGDLSDGPFAMVDVNSLYPYVMREHLYPVNVVEYAEPVTVDQLRKAIRNYGVIADVKLKTNKPYYAVRLKGKLTFPIGTFRAVLCTRSLTEALRRGHVVEAYRASAYKMRPLFRRFVDYFANLRNLYKEKKNVVWEHTCKLIANSLYGKFGQANPLTVKQERVNDGTLWRTVCVDDEADRVLTVTQCMGKRWETSGRVEASDAMPAVAAHVTDYGRWHLVGAIERVGWGRVLYCDTDSLILQDLDVKRLGDMVDPVRLGAWKLVKMWEHLRIWGAKDYVGDGVRVLKGVGALAQEIERDVWADVRFPGLKSLLRMSAADRQKHDLPLWSNASEVRIFQGLGLYPVEKVTKHLTRRYEKGEVDAKGRVRPYRLLETATAGDVT